MEQLQQRLFEAIQEVRYVALAAGGTVDMRQRGTLDDASSNESDRYEELFVNPAVLLLATNRGRIDCGGLQYVLIRYGNFFQYVQPFRNGHVSIAIEKNAELSSVINKIQELLLDA